jgi:hypothetical protein
MLISIRIISAQSLFGTYDLKLKGVPTIGTMMAGDSILITSKSNGGLVRDALWISPQANKTSTDLGELQDKPLIAIVAGKTMDLYYFLEEHGNTNYLKCAVIDKVSGTRYVKDEFVELDDLPVGGYVDDGLNLICLTPKTNDVTVIKVADMRIMRETVFHLNAPLLRNKRTAVAFFDRRHPVRPDQATARVKLYLRDSLLIITCDEPFDEYDQPGTLYKTRVYELNLNSGTYSNRYFIEQSTQWFNSIIFNNYLYRVVQGEDGVLEIFDLVTGEQKPPVLFSAFQLSQPNRIYVSDDRNHSITMTTFKRTFANPTYVIPDTIGSEIILRIGERYGFRTTVGPLTAFGVAGLFLSVVTNVVLLSRPTEPVVDQYFYVKGSPANGFSYTADSGLLSQKISNYDVSVARDQKEYRFKSHLVGRTVAYEVYMQKKTNKVNVLKFLPD